MDFKSILLEMNDTYDIRNKEYGDSFSKLYDELGQTACVSQIYHKMSRLINETKKGEIKEDTLLDLANYVAMTLLEIRKDKYENN